MNGLEFDKDKTAALTAEWALERAEVILANMALESWARWVCAPQRPYAVRDAFSEHDLKLFRGESLMTDKADTASEPCSICGVLVSQVPGEGHHWGQCAICKKWNTCAPLAAPAPPADGVLNDQMVERGARALHDLKFDSSEGWDTHNADYQNLYRSGARAVLAAALSPARGDRETIARAIFKSRLRVSDQTADVYFARRASHPHAIDDSTMAVDAAFRDADALIAAGLSLPVQYGAGDRESGLRALALDMGRVIRRLDESGQHSEFWTQDEDYIIDGRFSK